MPACLCTSADSLEKIANFYLCIQAMIYYASIISIFPNHLLHHESDGVHILKVGVLWHQGLVNKIFLPCCRIHMYVQPKIHPYCIVK